MKYTVALLFLVGFIAFIGAAPIEEDIQDSSVADPEIETAPEQEAMPEEPKEDDVKQEEDDIKQEEDDAEQEEADEGEEVKNDEDDEPINEEEDEDKAEKPANEVSDPKIGPKPLRGFPNCKRVPRGHRYRCQNKVLRQRLHRLLQHYHSIYFPRCYYKNRCVRKRRRNGYYTHRCHQFRICYHLKRVRIPTSICSHRYCSRTCRRRSKRVHRCARFRCQLRWRRHSCHHH